jgi:spore coat polysaccharide biosynthesis predicted glycosyltransferase SpsG
MSREAVVLRVDAGYSFGWDAWNRCQVLAYGLQRRRRPCYFLSHLEPNGLALSLKRSGHDWLAAEHPAGSPGDLEQLLRELRRLQAVAVIVDAAAIGPDYLAELAAAGILVVSVDTRAGFRSPAHLVLNPTLNRSGQEYEVCGDGQVLCGPRYVLVRPEIKRVRPQRSLEPPEPTRVVVALGDDQAKLSQAVVKTLLGMKTIARIEVLTWAHHPCVTALQSCLEKEPERITLATEPSSWGLAMMRSHLAIAASGPWALELAYVGVPVSYTHLVGSEMCIRDRCTDHPHQRSSRPGTHSGNPAGRGNRPLSRTRRRFLPKRPACCHRGPFERCPGAAHDVAAWSCLPGRSWD